MLKILKNLQKTWVSVVFIILLLCLQAATDLALPEYTSKIVNVGIQQGGIENASPEVMTQNTMNALLTVSNDETILNSYEMISRENLSEKEYDKYVKYVKKYPALEKENLYLRPRFSPGYGDFHLKHQKDMILLLDCPRKIGLTLTDSLLLAPSKSVTAVMGISKKNKHCHIKGCEACENRNCTFRRDG